MLNDEEPLNSEGLLNVAVPLENVEVAFEKDVAAAKREPGGYEGGNTGGGAAALTGERGEETSGEGLTARCEVAEMASEEMAVLRWGLRCCC